MGRALLTGAWLSAALLLGCFTRYDSNAAPSDAGSAATDAAATGTLSTTPIDFGLVGCGSAAPAKSFALENTGTVPITWSASVDSVFALQGPSSGTVAPGASASLAVGVAMVPVTADPGVAISGTVTVTTNVATLAQAKVAVSVTPQGGSLVLSTAITGFGTVQLSTVGGPLGVGLQNVGNAPVSVTFGTPSDPEFAVTYTGAPAAASIAPGTSLAGASATFMPTVASARSATVAIQSTGALCASAATSLSLAGTGTAAPVSIGPSPLDFGAVPCGKTASPQTLTIKNGYGAAFTFQAALGLTSASPYSLSASSGSVPPMGSATITVTPAGIPFPGNTAMGAYDDTLTVTTTAPNAMPVAIPLTELASGAVLTVSAPSTAFGTVAGTTASLPFTVTNAGTVGATVGLDPMGPGFGAVFTGSNVVSAGGSQPGTMTFTPTADAPASGSLGLTTTAPLCAALPAPLAFSATGEVPIATFATTALTTGFAPTPPCSSGSFSATLSIQNTGQAPLLLSSPAGMTAYLTIVSYTTTAIPPGQFGTIVIQGVFPSGYQGAGAQDSLTFTTNEPGALSHSVPVTIEFLPNC